MSCSGWSSCHHWAARPSGKGGRRIKVIEPCFDWMDSLGACAWSAPSALCIVATRILFRSGSIEAGMELGPVLRRSRLDLVTRHLTMH